MSKEKYVRILEGVNSNSIDRIDEKVADMKIVKKVQSILKDVDKTTMSEIAKWIRTETDKVKI